MRSSRTVALVVACSALAGCGFGSGTLLVVGMLAFVLLRSRGWTKQKCPDCGQSGFDPTHDENCVPRWECAHCGKQVHGDVDVDL